MVKLLTAFTEELDTPEGAIDELKLQLETGGNLSANSVGIVHCHPDFITNGTIAAISETFAFPVVGCATCAASVSDSISSLGLSLTVLTGDDVRFAAAESAKLSHGNYGEEVAGLYSKLTEGETDKPVLLLPYISLFMDVSGDQALAALSSAAPNVPAFGSVAVTTDPSYAGSFAFINGKICDGSFACVAVFGDIKPNFYTVAVKPEKIIRLRQYITESRGNAIISVDNKPYDKFTEIIGLDTNSTVTFQLYGSDGAILNRVCFATSADGYGLCVGDVPEGYEIALCTQPTLETVVETAEELISQIRNESESTESALIYSCAARFWTLGMDIDVEQRAVRKVSGDMPFSFTYSGGEVYPQILPDGRVINLLQNNSLTVCVI